MISAVSRIGRRIGIFRKRSASTWATGRFFQATEFDVGRDFPPGMTSWLDWSPFTYPFNFSGHPAVSMPCGFVDGLPVGLLIVGPRWREDLVLRASRCLEAANPIVLPLRPQP